MMQLANSFITMSGRIVLALLSGVLLCLPCLDDGWFLVGWIGLVPLLIASAGCSLRQSYFLGAITGTVFWAGVSYWLIDFTTNLKGYPPPFSTLIAAVFWLYAGQGFGLMLACYHWLHQQIRLSEVFLFPVIFVAIFSLYPILFHFRLGEGQTSFILALQGADLVGAHGIDFMMVLCSAVLFRVIKQRTLQADGILAGVLLSAWFAYGYHSLNQWDTAIRTWPSKRIGIVQPNDQPSIEIPPPEPGYSRALPPEMAMTARLAAAGAQFVVWPEARYKGYFEQRAVQDAYAYSVSQHGAAVLFHDLERRQQAGRYLQHNAAVLLDESGQQHGIYRKMKLFAFGEYTPLVGELPWVRERVASYFGDFLADLTPGSAHESWSVAGMRVVPKICYESAFPEFIAQAIEAEPVGAVVVILSQDGWFGESRQPYQHLWQSAVRAVENRVPVVHAINNGPSGVILPSGRYAFQSEPFVRGEYLVDLPYSEASGGSFYSRYPYLFIASVYVVFGLFVLLSLLAHRRAGRTAPAAEY